MAGVESRQSAILVVTIIFFALASVFVALRFVSRIGVVRRVQMDDYFMLAAWVVSLGLTFSICYGTTVGLGRHQWDIPEEWHPALKKSEYAFSVLYNPALMLTKTSILVFFLRLSKTEKVFRWACIATLVVVNGGGLALTALNVAQCRPLSSAFQTPIPTGAKCTDIVTLYLSSAPLNIITDLAILFLPFPILTSMSLPKKQKIILLITFGFGVFVAVVDVVRIAYLQDAFTNRIEDVQRDSGTEGPDARNTSDFSWYASISYTWSAIEVNVGSMVACVPALKPLVARFMPHMIRAAGETEFTRRESEMSRNTGELRDAQRIPSVPSAQRSPTGERSMTPESAGATMGFVEFLTTPDMVDLPEPQRTQTAMTNTSRHTPGNQASLFDFVDMQRKKSMVHMTNHESLFPVAMVTVLFFVWGFAYGLLDSLNSQFQRVANISAWQSVGIHSAYFAGYCFGPLSFGRLVLRHWGFKACYVVGLAVYACGTLTFWPAAVLTSFPAFLISNFIVGTGLSTLEISANPFIALCGPREYMEIRLNLSQAVQAVATVVAPLLASKVLFAGTKDAESLIDVQWTYLGISLFTIVLALGYYYVPLPEATDAELDAAAERADGANDAKMRNPLLRGAAVKFATITLALGILSEFCYVGGQEAISTSFSSYIRRTAPSLDVVNHQAIGHAAFATSRFLAAGLNYWIKARYLLLFFYAGTIIFAALCMADLDTSSSAAVIVMLYFFEGPLFSFIFALSLRGLGRQTKDASALLTAAISGGGVIQPIMHAISTGNTLRNSYSIAVAVFGVGSLFGCWVNATGPVRRIVDPAKQWPDDAASDDHVYGAASMPRNAARIWHSCWKRRRKEDSYDRNDGERLSEEHKEKL